MRVPAVAVLVLLVAIGTARAEPIAIVAAENFYGDVARQIGGSAVAVTSILTNPDQDPHLFEASASTARAIAAARIVIFNGAGYDDWMARLLAGSSGTNRAVIEVASLTGRKPGDNPHLWYDPATMPAVAGALAARLSHDDPGHRAAYARNLAGFNESLVPLTTKIAAMRRADAGLPVTATEPVFGYMAAALGLRMRNERFQLAIMNGTEPAPSDIAAFETDLKMRRVRVLLYNSQTSGPLTSRMQAFAKGAGIPVVGVSETEPPGARYQDWMMTELSALDRALSVPPP